VEFITPLLDDIAVDGRYLPHKLTANAGKSFQGSIVLGMGFVLEPEEAQALIDQDPRNADVLFPYLNGEDLNSEPDQRPTRWVINFFDWDEERAMKYPDAYAIVREKVYPERTRLKPNGEFALRSPLPQKWWIYAEKRPALYRTIAPLRRVIVIALTSRTVAFSLLPTGTVFSHATGVIAFDRYGSFAAIQSTIHNAWAWQYASSMKGDLRYTPSDVFENFAFPAEEVLAALDPVGEAYHETRRQIMLDRQEGLTATYNRFHDPDEHSRDIQTLRDLHTAMDAAVAAAYGWDDLALDHDFYDTAQGVRFTISEPARREVLKRLLALNFARHKEEERTGVLGSGSKKRKAAASDQPAREQPASKPATQPVDGGHAGTGKRGRFGIRPFGAADDESGGDDDQPEQKRLF
jgi:hypothetical protein